MKDCRFVLFKVYGGCIVPGAACLAVQFTG
jgi:hypothetical protein